LKGRGKWWKIGAQLRVLELKHVFHLGDIAQPVLAQVDERGIVRPRPTH